MAKEIDIKSGLELDKIEVPNSRPVSSLKKPSERSPSQKDPKPSSQKLSKLPVFVLIAGVISLLGLVFVLWDQAIIDLPLLKSKYAERVLERYATIGPMMVSTGKDQHIKFTIMVECKNTKLKDRVVKLEAKIKNRLLEALTSAEGKKYLNKQDFKSLKPYFKKQINRIVKGNPAKNVYFSQIFRY
ncbi:MAG: flagellar basal body-associated FliL family protein [Deltaproteobacteria bacterium]|nr:flagellar basal body-associated FliL family protein [Deltaproteobacteria bacterium]MBW1996310.1 flagellar basal body-associated FliL family protein [Deltaproteobacteria bacterium]